MPLQTSWLDFSASSRHVLLTPWNFPLFLSWGKRVLCNYLNLSLLLVFNFFDGRIESVFCSKFSHKTFTCETDEILETKSFKWVFLFLTEKLEVFFLVSVSLKEWGLLWACSHPGSHGNSVFKVKNRRHLIFAFLNSSYHDSFYFWQGKILWFCPSLMEDLTHSILLLSPVI